MINIISGQKKWGFLFAIVISIALSLGTLSPAFAAVDVTFTTNGAKGNYIPGSSLMVFGKVDNQGIGVPATSTFIEADINGRNIFYGPVKTDGNGYFKTGFNIPISSVVGQTLTITINNNQKQQYVIKDRNQIINDESKNPFDLVGFTAVGYLEGQAAKEILSSTSELGLVFTKNVNYFKNSSAAEELQYIGAIDKNADCFTLYEAGQRVPIYVDLLNSGGDEVIPYTNRVNGNPQYTEAKRLIKIKPVNGLKPDTEYKLYIRKDLVSNSSVPLEKDIVVNYKTASAEKEKIVGGGGAKIPVADETISTSGGRISETGVTIIIPANATKDKIKVTIEKLLEPETLPIAQGSKLVSDVFEILKDKSGDFSKPVTISLNFDKSKVDITKHDLTICYIGEADNNWIPLDNIKIDWDKSVVSGEVSHFTKFAVIVTEKGELGDKGEQINLSDIRDHWAEKNIAELVATGAIAGYPDGTFKPDNTITRAEFSSILVKAFKLETKSGKVFNDTIGHWGKDYISTAAAHGIVSGYSDNAFGPDDSITREQMAVMIVKAAKLSDTLEGKTFADGNKVSAWAQNAVVTTHEKNIISGYPDNTFQPKKNATRAEAATVIIKSLKHVF
ncbi:S-layer homology domain [Syntrophomonas zehnderi OL-4]|uniref:S-layer homology domain n=1 Tax=Syntrophomonas zehnderi OL-4 TaxID=690567 RepID=A0A0E4GBD9_9FIRM|nr:S-layer homology domain-containing protein [Syntrophomonas zehnderi]CFX39840.1 S-layer homology domain [Syntrophomonas zehnderi OL-4]